MGNPLVVLDASLILAGVDLSSSTKKAVLNLGADTHDVSAMSAAAWKAFAAGAKNGTLDIEFWNDYDANKVDATLWAQLGNTVTFSTKAVAAASTAVTNPLYAGSCIVNASQPGGTYNAPASMSLSFPITGIPTRATT